MRVDRHPVERFGLVLTACGILIATLIAWLVFKLGWGQTDYTAASNWQAYQHTRWAATQGCVVLGIAFTILGSILVLVGKAVRRPII